MNLVTQISCHITLYLGSNYWSNACLNETKYALLLGIERVVMSTRAIGVGVLLVVNCGFLEM
jgi:hypothetical protein